MRCDINISVRDVTSLVTAPTQPLDASHLATALAAMPLGTRSEMKNVFGIRILRDSIGALHNGPCSCMHWHGAMA